MNLLSVFTHVHDQCFVAQNTGDLLPVALKTMHTACAYSILPELAK